MDRTGYFTRRDRFGYPATHPFQQRLLILLQQWEDEVLIAQRQDDFQQRVMAAELVWNAELPISKALFSDGAAEKVDDDGIYFPSSPEEYDAMLKAWEHEGDLHIPQ